METEKGAHTSTSVPIPVLTRREEAQINGMAGCPYCTGDQCRKLQPFSEIEYFHLRDKIIL